MIDNKNKAHCQALVDLIGKDDIGGYDAFVYHMDASWVNETTQLKQISLDAIPYDSEQPYREPKPIMYYVQNPISPIAETIPPLEYYEYPLVKWQTVDGHRYYLGVNEETNTIVYAYAGRSRS